MRSMSSYMYVLLAVLLVVYGQIIIKWQVARSGELPTDAAGQIGFTVRLLTSPLIASGLFAALIAAILWMLALAKLPLSHAYPFLSLTFVLVTLLSGVVLQEAITWPKLAGVAFIVAGVAVSSQG